VTEISKMVICIKKVKLKGQFPVFRQEKGIPVSDYLMCTLVSVVKSEWRDPGARLCQK
jgi:hypothetical protein